MILWSDSFRDGGRIPEEFAFGRPHPRTHIEPADNRNPHLAWSGIPPGARSLALICHDSDAPSRPDTVNREGIIVPPDLPRTDFYHWILVDIPPAWNSLQAGEFSDGVVAGGKPGPACAKGLRHGLNSYTEWFAGDPAMAGAYFGYDGPCPPWNDSLIHHYHFTLYALDLDRCPVEGAFTGPEVLRAIAGHVLDQARLTGLYAINPEAR